MKRNSNTADDIVLHEKAAADLQFIRSAMERASSFTAVPGLGGVAMGATALVAAWLASTRATTAEWAFVWLAELVVAVVIGLATMIRKADRLRQPLTGAIARRFALSFAAPAFVGAVLTPVLLWRNEPELLPAVWLLCYGAAVVAGGTMSVVAVPLMGAGFLILGTVAAVMPQWGDVMMAAGFGVLQIGVGAFIARRHGG